MSFNVHTAKGQSNPEVTMSPDYPRTDDNIQITVTFTFNSSPPYVSDWGTLIQIDNTIIVGIRIDFPSGIIYPAITIDSHNYSLGQLPEGAYQFRAYSQVVGEHPITYDVGSINFTVIGLGDLNIDHKVDIRDLAVAAKAFGSYQGSPTWNPIVDSNRDKLVDIRDLVIIARNFGKTYP